MGYIPAPGSSQKGYGRSGNWLLGYQGTASYKPQQYEIDRGAQDLGQRGEDIWGQNQAAYNRGYGSGGEFLQGQMGLMGDLQARVRGQGGPSPAELQMLQGLERAQRQAMGIAAANPNVEGNLAFRRAMQAERGLAADTIQNQGILRAEEQRQAASLLASLLGQGRGQSMQEAQFGMGQMTSQMEADRQARMQMEAMYAAQNQAFQQMLMNQAIANAQQQTGGGLLGPLMSMAGAIGGGMLGGPGGAIAGSKAGAFFRGTPIGRGPMSSPTSPPPPSWTSNPLNNSDYGRDYAYA